MVLKLENINLSRYCFFVSIFLLLCHPSSPTPPCQNGLQTHLKLPKLKEIWIIDVMRIDNLLMSRLGQSLGLLFKHHWHSLISSWILVYLPKHFLRQGTVGTYLSDGQKNNQNDFSFGIVCFGCTLCKALCKHRSKTVVSFSMQKSYASTRICC